MKTLRKSTRMFTMALAIAAISAVAWAAGPQDCGLAGSWYGHVGSTLTFLGVMTAGTNGTKGEMVLDWVTVKSYLIEPAVRLTDGRGVWENAGKSLYKYTWYAYGIDANGQKLFSVRASGLATNVDCDNIAIAYTYEMFYPSVDPPDMSGVTPFATIVDTDAGVKRLPLTVVPPPS